MPRTIFEGIGRKQSKPFFVNVYYDVTGTEIVYGNVRCKTRKDAQAIAKRIYPPAYRIRVIPKVGQ